MSGIPKSRISKGGRPGRPRVAYAKRRQKTRKGQGREEIDLGTPLLQAHRRELAGDKPQYAESALGQLYARGWIGEQEHKAGELYAALRYIAYNKPFAQISRYSDLVSDHVGGEWRDMTSDERLEAATRSYQRADRALVRGGVRTAIWNLCVANELPFWLARKTLVERKSEVLDIFRGLKILVKEFGFGMG